MSTRANIIIKDQYDKLFFYRHSDGYPEGTLPTLEKFLNYVKEGHIRDNVGQAAGWLILIGAEEYAEYRKDVSNLCAPDFDHDFNGWKAGAYEITTGIHGDIEFLYIIDLDKKTIEIVVNGFEAYE
jgi:hypothetical protein